MLEKLYILDPLLLDTGIYKTKVTFTSNGSSLLRVEIKVFVVAFSQKSIFTFVKIFMSPKVFAKICVRQKKHMCAAARKTLAVSQNFEFFSRKFSGKQKELGDRKSYVIFAKMEMFGRFSENE